MSRAVVLILSIGLFGLAKLPMERAVSVRQAELHLRAVDFNPALRNQIGQFAFVAGLSGFRSLVADLLFILIVVGFFGLMVLLVKACDHIIGPDESYESYESSAELTDSTDEELDRRPPTGWTTPKPTVEQSKDTKVEPQDAAVN